MKIDRRLFAGLALGTLGSAIAPENLGAVEQRVASFSTDALPKPAFLWGTATSAYQTEGGNVNTDLWLLEHVNSGLFKEKSGDACDHYHRYATDISLLASLGFNSYRFSIEWARVEPEEGEFSLAQLEHYRRMAETCRISGLAPMITLHHFSSPLWFSRSGGWEQPNASALFARYCGKVAERLGYLVTSACTINEINVPAIILRRNYFSEKARSQFQSAISSSIQSANFSTFLTGDPQILRKTLIEAHKHGCNAFKAVCPNVPLGMNLAIMDDQSVDDGEAKLQEYQDLCYNSYLEVAGADDFVAIQTYTRNLVGPDGEREPGANARKLRRDGSSIRSPSSIRSATLHNVAKSRSLSLRMELLQTVTKNGSSIFAQRSTGCSVVLEME